MVLCYPKKNQSSGKESLKRIMPPRNIKFHLSLLTCLRLTAHQTLWYLNWRATLVFTKQCDMQSDRLQNEVMVHGGQRFLLFARFARSSCGLLFGLERSSEPLIQGRSGYSQAINCRQTRHFKLIMTEQFLRTGLLDSCFKKSAAKELFVCKKRFKSPAFQNVGLPNHDHMIHS